MTVSNLIGVDRQGGRGYQLVSCSRCGGDLYIGRDSEEGTCGQCATRFCSCTELDQPQPGALGSFSGDRERACPHCGAVIPVSRVTCPHCHVAVYRKLVGAQVEPVEPREWPGGKLPKSRRGSSFIFCRARSHRVHLQVCLQACGKAGKCKDLLAALSEEDQKKLQAFLRGKEISARTAIEEVPVEQRAGGRPKKAAVDLQAIDFSGLEAAVESGNGKLREWRESQGLSQSDIASILEITKRQYQRIEETGKISSRIQGRIWNLLER